MPTEDGGLDLFDLLYDRVVHLTPDEVHALDAGDPTLRQRLEALVLLEGEHADTLRHQLWTRRRAEVGPTNAPAVGQVDWTEAEAWPELVAGPWRDPERLRRLAESRAAGCTFLELPGFVTAAAAHRIAAVARALPFERMDTEWVQGERRLLVGDELQTWTDFLSDERTRRLFGGLLGRHLPELITANVWRLSEGDGMPVHADGRRYHGTVSLGLSEGWTAAHGGAIATGAPVNERFDVRHRWLPHAGDLLLFAPTRTSWHAVEPVAKGPRLSVTAWWTGGEVSS